jgi:hypothetical protein
MTRSCLFSLAVLAALATSVLACGTQPDEETEASESNIGAGDDAPNPVVFRRTLTAEPWAGTLCGDDGTKGLMTCRNAISPQSAEWKKQTETAHGYDCALHYGREDFKPTTCGWHCLMEAKLTCCPKATPPRFIGGAHCAQPYELQRERDLAGESTG